MNVDWNDLRLTLDPVLMMLLLTSAPHSEGRLFHIDAVPLLLTLIR